MSMERSAKQRRVGFTLVEVLFCFVIIAVLASLLWPLGGAIKNRSLLVRCSGNLRQVGMALMSYSAEHRGLIPARIQADPDKPGLYLTTTYWHMVLISERYLEANPKLALNKQGIYFCPAFKYNGKNPEAYGIRRWRTPGKEMDTSQNLLALTDPSRFFLVVDSYNTTDDRQGYFVHNAVNGWLIGLYHGGLANTLFADGHVAAMDQKYFEEVSAKQAEYGESTKAYPYWQPPSQ